MEEADNEWGPSTSKDAQNGDGGVSTTKRCFWESTKDKNAPHRLEIISLRKNRGELPSIPEDAVVDLGQGRLVSKLKDKMQEAESAAQMVLMREYQELTENEGKPFKARMIPFCFISKLPQFLDYGKRRKPTAQKQHELDGDKNERYFFDQIQDFLKDEVVSVLIVAMIA